MANENYLGVGTELQINGEGGADYAWSVENLVDDNGRVSARIDLGAAPRPYLYRWRCKCEWDANPTQGNALKLYKSESDGTYEDGDVGAVDAALGDSDILRNLKMFGRVVADEANTTDMQNGGVVEIYERYVSMVAWNDGGADLEITDSNFQFFLTPIYDQQQ
jgi:hypothetical protein